MSQLYMNAYINFSGRAREAMEFYQQALGGKLDFSTVDEKTGEHRPAREGESIIHARLESDSAIIMASDGMPDQPPTVGNNIAIALGGPTDAEDRLNQAFKALSDGGKVTMPLEKAPWGDSFGMFTDKFGIHWLVNIGQQS